MTNDEKIIKTRMTNDEFFALSHLIIFSDFPAKAGSRCCGDGFLISDFSQYGL